MITSRKTSQGDMTVAVDGQGICFYFDKKKKSPVLNGVDIVVTSGIIYSLLGPSGCGKTTLLKCIVGQHKLQQGSLKIYGKTPGSRGSSIPGRGVGYMPQDLALYPEMTIDEALSYFGALYLMDRQQIKERISFLIDFLVLPNKSRQIKNLSGGQQRRVSFAVALLHKPPLLILDEPTVGVDPILRQSIWAHLVTLAKNEKMTIIVTTHYIEEARQAQVVGLMRDGRLLAEGNPEDLIKKYGAITLEDAFLKLCQNEQAENEYCETSFSALASVKILPRNCSEQNGTMCTEKLASEAYMNGVIAKHSFEMLPNGGSDTVAGSMDETDNATALLSSSSVPKEVDAATDCTRCLVESCKRFACLTNKNFLRLRRNTLFLLFQLFFPALQAAIFLMAIGADPFDLPIATANLEESPDGLGSTFLNMLSNHTFRQKNFSSLSTAIESVKTGESWAALYIGPEFTSCIVERVLEGVDAVNETIMCGNIKIYFDMSNKQIVSSIYFYFIMTFQVFAKETLALYGKNPLLAEPPLLIEEPIYGTPDSTFTEFISPGMMLGIIFIMSVALAEMAIITERKQGILERTLAAGASSTEVFLSIFFVLLCSMSIQVILVLITSFTIFQLPCNGPFIWTVVSYFLTGVSGMTYGLFISTVCTDENFAVIIAMGSFYILLLLSGIIWPIQGMPYYLRYLSKCLPLTLITESLRSVLSRGWTITDYDTWIGFLIPSGWSFVLIFVSIILFKIQK